jgi:hypothetical protein
LIDGLIVTSDKNIFDEFSINFSSDKSNFEYADSLPTAQELLELEPFDYLIIIEKEIADIVGILSILLKLDTCPKQHIICATASSTWPEREKLWQKGVKDIIHLPIGIEELQFRFERFITDISNLDIDEKTSGMHGKLEDYNLFDIIQTLEQNKKSGILNLYFGRHEGKIWFHNGEVCDAKFKSMEQMDALLKLMTWMQGDFSISFNEEEYEKKIELDTQQILLEAIQYIDRRNKILDTLPDIHNTLVISTLPDLDRMGVEDATYLRFFHGGQTILAFLSDFDIDEIVLLEKVKSFVNAKFLMTREEFDNLMTEQEREIADAGLKNVFKKFFRSKDQELKTMDAQKAAKVAEPDREVKEKREEIEQKIESLFNPKRVELVKFKQKLEKL